ncbi:unnamed protein product [Lupinus luteus]|uniref:S-protein homolog n=1 Tax=Lupinus luteus TaxID=3873 RepID=A0AAV1X765_LUPLU
MATLVYKIVLLSLMLVTIFVTSQMMDGAEAFKIIPKAHIGITNSLTGLQLSFRCKDKTRDNGFHTLAPHETYNFGFKIDIYFNTTQWFCHFDWEGESHFFDIYVRTRDRCWDCYWIIQKTGPCKIKLNNQFDCYGWDNELQHELQGWKRLLNSNTTTQQESPLDLKPLNSQGSE